MNAPKFDVPETILDMATSLRVGDFDEARQLGREVIKKADPRAWHIIHMVADVLENRPRAAVAILRKWWKDAPTAADRALIAACAPSEEDQRQRRAPATTDRQPYYNGRNNHQAPSTVQTRQGTRQRRRSRQEAADAAAIQRYQAERAGMADGPQILDRDDRARAEQVYASGFDYDRAALYGTEVPFRCLSCSISRGRYDLDRARTRAGHGDDGLCADCRESGRPGIPALPSGHTPAEAITARCAFILASLPAAAARISLLSDWRSAPTATAQGVIVEFAQTHLPAKPAATPAADLGVCATCPDPRTARDLRGITEDDGMCAACRAEGDNQTTAPVCELCTEPCPPADDDGSTWDAALCGGCRSELATA